MAYGVHAADPFSLPSNAVDENRGTDVRRVGAEKCSTTGFRLDQAAQDPTPSRN